jgi:hypothetical protein
MISGNNSWYVWSQYCSQGVCGITGGTLYSNASYEQLYISREERKMGPSSFGGSVTKSTACGVSDWIRSATKYVDGDESQTITGWYAVAVLCPGGKWCRSYKSDNKYTLYPSPFSGKFTAAYWFGQSCFPSSVSRTLTVKP